MKLITTEKIPSHMVCYIEYVEECSYNMTNEEIKEIDEWLLNNFPNGFTTDIHGDEYFSVCPLIRLPCTVVDVDFYA